MDIQYSPNFFLNFLCCLSLIAKTHFYLLLFFVHFKKVLPGKQLKIDSFYCHMALHTQSYMYCDSV